MSTDTATVDGDVVDTTTPVQPVARASMVVAAPNGAVDSRPQPDRSGRASVIRMGNRATVRSFMTLSLAEGGYGGSQV